MYKTIYNGNIDSTFILIFFSLDRLKLRLLGECTKLQYHDTKTPNQIILTGYSHAAGELHIFDEKIPTNKNDDETTDTADKLQSVLWDQIKLGSQHLDDWNGLFSMDNTELHTTM